MRNYYHTRLAGNIVNLTKEKFSLYMESSGILVDFLPHKKAKLPKAPTWRHKKGNSPVIYYVVEKKEYNKIKESGRKLDDIAVVSKKVVGRDGVLIAKLFWGENPSIEIRLCGDWDLIMYYNE